MSIHNIKVLKGIICGLIALSIISIVCAGAGVENTAVPAKEAAAVQAKVGAGSLPVAVTSAGSFFPEFDKIKVDPAYKYLQLQYFTNWIRKSSSFIPISKYFPVKCLKS